MAKNLNFVMLLDCYGELLTDHQKNVMELYYCEDLSLAEIAEPLNITRQAVLSLLKRTENILLNYEKKLHFSERSSKLREKFQNISSCLENINDEKIKKLISDEIEEGSKLL